MFIFWVFGITLLVSIAAFNTLCVCVQLSLLLSIFVKCESLTVTVPFMCVTLCSSLHIFSDFTFMMSVTLLSAAPTPLLWILFFSFCLSFLQEFNK